MTKGLMKVIESYKANNIPQEYIDFVIEKNCKIKDAKAIGWIFYDTREHSMNTSLDDISRLDNVCYHTPCDLLLTYDAFGFDFDKIQRYTQLYTKYAYIPKVLYEELYLKSIEYHEEYKKVGISRNRYSNWLEEHEWDNNNDEEFEKNEKIERRLTSQMIDINNNIYHLYGYQRCVSEEYSAFIVDLINYSVKDDIIDYFMKKEEGLRLYQYQYKSKFGHSKQTGINCSNFKFIHSSSIPEQKKYKDLLYKDLNNREMKSLMVKLLDNNLLLHDSNASPEVVVNYFINNPEKLIGKDSVINIDNDDYIKILQGKNVFFEVSKEFLDSHNKEQEWVRDMICSSLYHVHPSIQKVIDLDLKCDTKVELPYYELDICIHRNGYINISLRNYSSTIISYSYGINDEGEIHHYDVHGNNYKYDNFKLTITPDGNLYEGHNNIKPISLKRIYQYLKNPFFKE